MTISREFISRFKSLTEKIVTVEWGGKEYPHRHTAEVESNGNGKTTATTDGAPDHVHEILQFKVVATGGHTHPPLQSAVVERKWDSRFPMPKQLSSQQFQEFVAEVSARLGGEFSIDDNVATVSDKHYVITIDNNSGLVEIMGDVTTQSTIKDVMRDQYLTI